MYPLIAFTKHTSFDFVRMRFRWMECVDFFQNSAISDCASRHCATCKSRDTSVKNGQVIVKGKGSQPRIQSYERNMRSPFSVVILPELNKLNIDENKTCLFIFLLLPIHTCSNLKMTKRTMPVEHRPSRTSCFHQLVWHILCIDIKYVRLRSLVGPRSLADSQIVGRFPHWGLIHTTPFQIMGQCLYEVKG